jgi:hypothetical protein
MLWRQIILTAVVGLAACKGNDDTDDTDMNIDTDITVSDDADADGVTAADGDCDDNDATVHPGAAETCDGVDQDCDTVVDNDATDATDWYADADGDGHGAGAATSACTAPTGSVDSDDDCDDADATAFPGATEVCDGADQDCDGTADNGVMSTFYADADTDTYGDPTASTDACTAPSGYVADDSDCNDADGAVNPAATEVCDSADNDCDTVIDDGVTSTFYADADADTYGDPDTSWQGCAAPSGFVTDATDCDDTDADANPAGTEVCNGADDDCDGTADDGVDVAFYQDNDEDGFGDLATEARACAMPSGVVADSTDCDDTDSGVYPGAPELCDGMMDDCDGTGWTLADEDGLATWFPESGAAASNVTLSGAMTVPENGTMQLCPGTYSANLTMNTGAVTVRSRDGDPAAAAVTILDGGAAGSVLNGTYGTYTVTGLTLQNGAGTDLGGVLSGGAIYAGAATFVVAHSVIADNVAAVGGGIYLHYDVAAGGAFLQVTDTAIVRNTATFGGGLYINTASTATGDATFGDGADENTVNDVATAANTYDFDGSTTLSCDATSCL